MSQPGGGHPRQQRRRLPPKQARYAADENRVRWQRVIRTPCTRWPPRRRARAHERWVEGLAHDS